MTDVRPVGLDFYDIPAELEQRFQRAVDGFDLFLLKTMYRGLRGQPFDPADPQAVEKIAKTLGLSAEKVGELADAYNSSIVAHARLGSEPAVQHPEGEVRFATRAMRPYSLDGAIDAVASNSIDGLITKRLFRALRGKALPAGEDADELRGRLRLSRAAYERASRHYELALLHHQAASKWRTYDHGRRRRRQGHKMALVLPRALALRLPMIFNNQNHEPVNGKDIWGKLSCSEPLRPGAVGIVAYVLGVSSHPERYARYGQVDDEGRVLTSKTRLYQTLAAIDQAAEPGGGGQKMIDEYLGQLDRMKLRAGVEDKKGIRYSDRVPEMTIPIEPFTIEKCVDGDDGELQWAPLSDERPYSRHKQFPIRFTIAPYWRTRVGEKGGPGDRIYLNPDVWRTLSPAGRAMYLEVRGRVAERDGDSRYAHVQWGATNRWALRFGLDHLRDDHREKIILAALADLYRVDQRIKGYAKPWHFYSNSNAKHYRVYVDSGKSAVRPELLPQLRRADFLLQLLDHDRGGKWPGRLNLAAASNAPPDTT